MSGYAYLVQCSDGSYYAGSTVNLDERIRQHNDPVLGAVYTRKRRPVVLVWAAEFSTIAEAFAFEKQIQGWGRRKREALIRGDFDALPALSRRKSRRRRRSS